MIYVGVIVGAGFTPYTSQLLVNWSGDSFAPAYLVVIASVVGLAVLAVSRRQTAAGCLEDSESPQSAPRIAREPNDR